MTAMPRRAHRSRRAHRRLGYPRPLVWRSCHGHVAAWGVAAWRDDPMARDRRPDHTRVLIKGWEAVIAMASRYIVVAAEVAV